MSTAFDNLSSFPPLFRQPTNPKPNPNPANIIIDSHHQQNLDSDDLPLIDFNHLNPEKLGEACRDWGVFRLVNHGIPVTLWSQLEEQSRKMFNLPYETKQTKFTDPIAYLWGTPSLANMDAVLAKSVEDQTICRVEGFHLPVGQSPLQLQKEDPMLDSFRCLLVEYGQHMARIGRSLFEALLINLRLDPSYYSQPYMADSTGLIRVYRYPHCPKANQVYGMNAHTDSSVFSVLNENEVGGLQVLKDDKWFEVKAVPGTLIVNLGDIMQAISNDEYKSVEHRVVSNQCDERISICYFVFPEDNCVIQGSKYKPFSYKEYRDKVQEEIKNTGFKVGGLDQFKVDE